MTAPQSTPLPPAPQRGESEDVFVNKSNTWVAAQEVFRQELQEQADFVNNEVVDLDNAVTSSAASASAALTSENNASTSESNASTSETNAAASELASSNSASAASNSASAASASESNAASSESAASASATTASNAAAAAEASETIATTKASEASTSAASSANSAALSQDARILAQAAGNYAGRWADLTGSVAAGVSVAHNSEYWGSLVSIADITLSEPGVSSDWQSITELSGTAAQRDTGKDFDQIPLNTNIVYPVATVADLRLLEPTVDGQRVDLLGHTLAGIGGGSFYAILNDVGGVDNNGTKFMTADGHSWNRRVDGNISVEMFGFHKTLSGAVNLSAINSAIELVSSEGGGYVDCYQAGECPFNGTIIPRRQTIFRGAGDTTTVLKLDDNSDVDPVKSESFDSLTLTGDTTSNPLCPYNFGFENVMIDGNGANQTAGEGVKLYGPRLRMKNFFVYRCRGDNLYTEYSSQFGSSDPSGQEEGDITGVISRNSVTGMGWKYRGPHNSIIGSVICAYNHTWGFKNEYSAGIYDGNISEFTHLHTYANGLDGTNSESHFGATTTLNHLIVDGGYCEIESSDCQIDKIKMIFGGQTNHGIILSGDHNNIGMINGAMLSGTSGYDLLRITGDNNWIGRARLNGSSNNHDGAVILGSGNTIDSLNSRECVRGLAVTGGLNTVNGKLLLCTDSFSYSTPTGTHPGKNKINLDIYQTSGSYVIGDRPVDQLDRFEISATGQGNLYTSAELQSGTVPLDTTAVQPISIPHGLLYTPTRQSVSLTRTTSSPTDTSFEPGDLRVVSTDATNINIELVMQTAAAAGSLGRVGVKVRI